MKHKKIILTTLSIMIFAISAFSIDLNQTKEQNSVELNSSLVNSETNLTDTLFEKRFVYFDQPLNEDENFELAKKVIMDAKRLGYNGIVLEQEWLYTRLSHKGQVLDKVTSYLSQLEKLAHKNGLELIAMHYRGNVANEVVHDGNENNPYYKEGFDFSESNKETTLYSVEGSNLKAVTTTQTVTKDLLHDTYSFTNIEPNTEYELSIDADTKDFKYSYLKVSVLDADHNGVNGKVIFGVNKYFENIEPNKKHGIYKVYFNSLDHKNQKGKIKVWIPETKGITINSATIRKTGYNPTLNVVRDDNKIIVTNKDGNITYNEDEDYRIDNGEITLLSPKIMKEKFIKVTWYPVINVSLNRDQLPFTDICADEDLYYKIILDQTHRINQSFNNKVDNYAFAIDEWRSAGWDDKCKELYKKELEENNVTDYTGGDYIGISVARTIAKITQDQNRSNLSFYLMSDMFDPNFNAKDPYMGVRNGALRAWQYLPKDQVIMFNWFPNPYEPGLEDKTEEDFLKSAKHFADNGIKQIIAGYHDDMRNLDSNIAVYKDSDPKTQKSIIGFMFLIWFQDGKEASYDDMENVVKKICTELPNKWPKDTCNRVLAK